MLSGEEPGKEYFDSGSGNEGREKSLPKSLTIIYFNENFVLNF